MVSALRRVSIILGILLVLIGTVFALQGDNIIGGSALMSGNPTYIYVGIAVVAFGLVLIMIGAFSGSRGLSSNPAVHPGGA